MLDLTNCDREPVHIPGSIQPFGALLVLDRDGHTVRRCSANVTAMMDLPQPPGRPFRLAALFVPEALADIQDAIAALGGEEGIGPTLRVRGHAGRFEVTPCRSGRDLILEVEPEPRPGPDPQPGDRFQTAAMAALEGADSVADLWAVAARELRRLSGYERVLVYRFHPDDHGEVVAEDCDSALEPYLGLHYPASDIPEPARRVFLLNRVRMIPDVAYEPVSIMPLAGETTPVDLTRSMLRSVSPIHLEYMHNMGQRASLTLSLVVGGRLWGLITCAHHSGPRFAPPALRAACEAIARFVATLIPVKEYMEDLREHNRIRTTYATLLRQMESEREFLQSLTRSPVNLLSLIPAHGAATFIREENHWRTFGATPPPDVLDTLAVWLARKGDQTMQSEDALPRTFAPAEEHGATAGGMLAIGIPDLAGTLVLWFRPEVVRTVTWGGDPRKAAEGEGMRLHPRKSFEAWKEDVHGRAEPWPRWTLEAARELRIGLLTVDLRRRLQRERSARSEAEQANRIKEDLMAFVSHDLKNPIGAIRLNAEILRRLVSPADIAEADRLLESIERTSERMRELIDELLDVARIEAGRMVFHFSSCRAADLVADTFEVLRPHADAKGIVLRFEPAGEAICVHCDHGRMLQVLANLVGNAIKFTGSGGEVRVAVRETSDGTEWAIQDTGAGIPPEHLPHIFDRYWHTKQGRAGGTGLGLAIAKGIVEAHGGAIHAESRPVEGTTFRFTLPRDEDAPRPSRENHAGHHAHNA